MCGPFMKCAGRGGRSGALGGWPSSVNATEMRTVWCSLVRALPLVEEWPFWTGGTRYPTPLMGHFCESKVRKIGVKLSPHVWPQATSGPRPLVSDLLPPPKMPVGVEAPPCSTVDSSGSAPRRSLLLPEAAAPHAQAQPVPHVHVNLTRQQRFDQALMQAAHGVAHCLTIACQGLQEQRNEPLSEDSLVAAYTLGRHFANNMRVPVQDCTDLLMRCTPFSPEVPDNHPGRLHAAVRVVDNPWRDDGGLAMLNELVALMARPVSLQHTHST